MVRVTRNMRSPTPQPRCAQQQDANSAGQPVTYTLLAAFFVGYAALSADAESVIANLLTVFPLTAPLVLPARSALVGVPLWEHLLALVLVLVSTHALASPACRPRLRPRPTARGPAPARAHGLAAHPPA